MMLLASLQVAYWHHATGGEFIVYSYQEQGFSWLRPHIGNGLFSYRAGWLTYTPIFILLVPGFALLRKQIPSLFLVLLGYTILFVYVAFAWDIWWYGASIGQRTMVQLYPLLLNPLGCVIGWVLESRRSIKLLFLLFLLTTSSYNLWLTHQAPRGGLLEAGNMTRAYFWAILGKNNLGDDVRKLLDTDERMPDGKRFAVERIPAVLIQRSDCEADHQLDTLVLACLTGDARSGISFQVEGEGLPTESAWFRSRLVLQTSEDNWNTNTMFQLHHRYYAGGELIKDKMLRVDRFLNSYPANGRKDFFFDSQLPLTRVDSIVVVMEAKGGENRLSLFALDCLLLE
jgi:hypothetical protein